MAPKYHPTPLSGGDRKALMKELTKSGGIALMLQRQADAARADGEALIRKANNLDCQAWNERMWGQGGPVDPSPTVAAAIDGSFPWLEIECSRCKTRRDVDLASLKTPVTTFVHDLASRLRCQRCAASGKRPAATLLQLAPQERYTSTGDCSSTALRNRQDWKHKMAITNEMLGKAVFDHWADLPRDIQELLFAAAVVHEPGATEHLAIELHDRHPRTAHPPLPVKTA